MKTDTKNIDTFVKKRAKVSKVRAIYSDTYREGKGSMAQEPENSLINKKLQDEFLEKFAS